ncbi:MAG: serine hydrolase [Pirellulaceae bacterium]
MLHKGRIITEQYFNGMNPSSLHHLWSASKSISVGVVFNLIEEGKLHPDDFVIRHVPELRTSGYQGATIRHLLDMQSGVKYEYGDLNLALNDSEAGKHFRAAGVFRKLPNEDVLAGQCSFIGTLRQSRDHGSMFYYKCADTAVLAWACERVSGVRFADLISQYIWSKLGAEQDAYIICDIAGETVPNAGISVTLRDLARWGQMHLRNGNWRGRKILPKKWLDDTQHNHNHKMIKKDSFLSKDSLVSKTAYRNQYWIVGESEGAYYAGGAYGQICYIHPKYDIVIARFASEWDDPNINWGRIIFPAFEEVAKAVAL